MENHSEKISAGIYGKIQAGKVEGRHQHRTEKASVKTDKIEI